MFFGRRATASIHFGFRKVLGGFRKMNGLRLTLACALWTAVCFGQNAQVSGLICDPSSLIVSGADVRILNEQTGGRRSTRSNDSGFYSLPSLAPGNYRITVRAPGFETIVRE